MFHRGLLGPDLRLHFGRLLLRYRLASDCSRLRLRLRGDRLDCGVRHGLAVLPSFRCYLRYLRGSSRRQFGVLRCGHFRRNLDCGVADRHVSGLCFSHRRRRLRGGLDSRLLFRDRRGFACDRCAGLQLFAGFAQFTIFPFATVSVAAATAAAAAGLILAFLASFGDQAFHAFLLCARFCCQSGNCRLRQFFRRRRGYWQGFLGSSDICNCRSRRFALLAWRAWVAFALAFSLLAGFPWFTWFPRFAPAFRTFARLAWRAWRTCGLGSPGRCDCRGLCGLVTQFRLASLALITIAAATSAAGAVALAVTASISFAALTGSLRICGYDWHRHWGRHHWFFPKQAE
jgi:hypothetical protein